MIFSFRNTGPPQICSLTMSGDIFCFFTAPDSVSCPAELWFSAICSSLKMKHDVLILEESLEQLPAWDKSRRWDQGENWCWLSSRALSTISVTYGKSPMNFSQFKSFLKSSK